MKVRRPPVPVCQYIGVTRQQTEIRWSNKQGTGCLSGRIATARMELNIHLTTKEGFSKFNFIQKKRLLVFSGFH